MATVSAIHLDPCLRCLTSIARYESQEPPAMAMTYLHAPHIEPPLKRQIAAQCTACSVCAEVEVYKFRPAVEGVVYDRSE